MNKYRSESQQIDDRACNILEYKAPNVFVFRRQGKDIGIDYEVEYFLPEDKILNKLQSSTGIIFKAQVKGVKSGKRIALNRSNALSKKLRIRDLEYWYKQIKIPVIIFLVDVESDKIYWVDFYSNEKLRSDFEKAKQYNQAVVNVHFPKNQTFPEKTSKLLATVSHAQQRIALLTLPDFAAIQEHFQETADIEKEISSIEERRALAYYQRFGRSLADDLNKAFLNAEEILEDRKFSDYIKLLTILSSGLIISNSDIPSSMKLDELTASLSWQVSAIKRYILISNDVEPVVRYTSDLLEAILRIRRVTKTIVEHKLKLKWYEARKDNSLASLSASIGFVFESNAFNEFTEAVKDFNKIVDNQKDIAIHLKATGLTAPYLIQAFIPLAQAFYFANEFDKENAVIEYGLYLMKFHIVICEAFQDHYLLNQNLVTLIMLFMKLEGDSDFSPIKEVVDAIEDESFRALAEGLYKELVGKAIETQAQMNESRNISDEIAARKAQAIEMARLEGIDLDKDSSEIQYNDQLQKMIHDVLRKGIIELDLTEYLIDCQFRHIFKPEFEGVSPVADLFGLGFASSRKSVMCMKKKLFSRSIPYYLKETFEDFYSEHCKGCAEIKPHPEGWRYTYNWQIEQDKKLQEFRSEQRNKDQ